MILQIIYRQRHYRNYRGITKQPIAAVTNLPSQKSPPLKTSPRKFRRGVQAGRISAHISPENSLAPNDELPPSSNRTIQQLQLIGSRFCRWGTSEGEHDMTPRPRTVWKLCQDLFGNVNGIPLESFPWKLETIPLGYRIFPKFQAPISDEHVPPRGEGSFGIVWRLAIPCRDSLVGKLNSGDEYAAFHHPPPNSKLRFPFLQGEGWNSQRLIKILRLSLKLRKVHSPAHPEQTNSECLPYRPFCSHLLFRPL